MSTMPLPALNIEECGEEAINEIMYVMEDAFDPGFGEAWSETQCLSIFAHRGVWGALALVDGEVAGFALARMILDQSELLLLGVRPRFRRLGAGRALLKAIARGAAGRGAARLDLEVREGNSAGDLYALEGFCPVGRRHNYYRGGNGRLFDAITLSRALS